MVFAVLGGIMFRQNIKIQNNFFFNFQQFGVQALGLFRITMLYSSNVIQLGKTITEIHVCAFEALM